MKSLIENFLAFMLYYSGIIKVLRDEGRKCAKILAFHSVSNSENIFVKGTYMWISASLFTKLCTYIRKYHKILSLQELVESLKEGKIQERSVAITFDDGFADNYHFAYPILKKYRISATIFLTIEAIDNRKPIWIQKLNYLINKIGIDKIVNKMKGLLDEPHFEQPVKNTNSRDSLHKHLEQFLAYKVSKQLREEILRNLYAEFSISMENIFLQNKIFLNWEDIKEMHANGIHFGNHGASHTPFSTMSINEQKAEVRHSRDQLRKNLDLEFLPFSYPFGQKRDFTEDTKKIIKESGHDCILTAMPTLNHNQTSPNELGRIHVGKSPVYRFAYELEKGVLKNWLKK